MVPALQITNMCYLGRLHDMRVVEKVQIKALILNDGTFNKLFNLSESQFLHQ